MLPKDEEKKLAEQRKAAEDKKAADDRKVAEDKKAADAKKADEAKKANTQKVANQPGKVTHPNDMNPNPNQPAAETVLDFSEDKKVDLPEAQLGPRVVVHNPLPPEQQQVIVQGPQVRIAKGTEPESIDKKKAEENKDRGVRIKSQEDAVAYFRKEYQMPDSEQFAYVCEDGNVFFQSQENSGLVHARQSNQKLYTVKS